ncbi:hypothetical protein ACFXTO_022617 [Malus domestica]
MRLAMMDFFNDMEDQGSTMVMDVDEVDPLEEFHEGVMVKGSSPINTVQHEASNSSCFSISDCNSKNNWSSKLAFLKFWNRT